jgi:hypothetical protein
MKGAKVKPAAVGSNNKIHNQFPFCAAAPPRSVHLALTLARPNKVTPTRVFLSLSPHYV